MTSKNEEDLNKKVMQFQLLQNNLSRMRQEIEGGAMRLEELVQSKTGLENLNMAKSGDAIFVPMGAGNFVEGKLDDPSRVLVALGDEAAVKRPRGEALEMIDKRINDLKSTLEELYKKEEKMAAEVRQMQPEIQALLDKKK